jgi:hypothetical protein
VAVTWMFKTTTHTVHGLHLLCYDGIIDTEGRSTYLLPRMLQSHFGFRTIVKLPLFGSEPTLIVSRIASESRLSLGKKYACLPGI